VSISDERKALLLRLERIVGNSCYNGNIKNFGPGGYEQADGRQFRYPVRFPGDTVRYRNVPVKIPADRLLSGYYQLGANQLGIFDALQKILTLLEREFDLQLDGRHDAENSGPVSPGS
jgi:hypothetical protein